MDFRIAVLLMVGLALLLGVVLGMVWLRRDGKRVGPPSTKAFQSVELLLGASDGKPAVVVSALDARELPPSARALPVASIAMTRLLPLLHAVRDQFPSEFGPGRYMKVIVDGPLAKAAGQRSFVPFVRGDDGRISSLARLSDPSSPWTLLTGAMLFQVASVLVAQKHLADIREKLEEIRRGLNNIRAFQQNERKSAITAALHYLLQQIPSLRDGVLPDAVRHQLESIERELLGVQDHLAMDLRAEADQIPSIKLGLFGTKGLHDRIADNFAGVLELQQQWLLCVRARIVNWQVLAAFPEDPQLTTARAAAIRQSIADVLGVEGLAGTLDQRWQKRIESIQSRWTKQAAGNRRQALHRIRQGAQEEAVQEDRKLIEELEQSVDRLSDYEKPLTVAIRLEGGRIVEAKEL